MLRKEEREKDDDDGVKTPLTDARGTAGARSGQVRVKCRWLRTPSRAIPALPHHCHDSISDEVHEMSRISSARWKAKSDLRAPIPGLDADAFTLLGK
jgi:hypothetical protein